MRTRVWKILAISCIISCCIYLGITKSSKIKSETDLESVKEVLSNYKEGYENKDYSLLSSCFYPPMNDYLRCTGDLMKTRKELLEMITDTWGKDWVEEKKLGKLVLDPIASVTEMQFSNIRIEGELAYADSETTTTTGKKLGFQVLAKSNGKWHIAPKNGSVGYDRKKTEAIQQMIKHTSEHTLLMGEFKKQIEDGTITQEEFFSDLAKSETQYINRMTPLMRR